MSSEMRKVPCRHPRDFGGNQHEYDLVPSPVVDPTLGSRSERLSRPALFMRVAELYGQRSSCPRANVGVIAVKEGRIVAAGYCGAPSGLEHCLDVGCELEDGHCVRSVHAEANMVAWAARTGTALDSSSVYCTVAPCGRCAQLMANAGIISLTWQHVYSSDWGVQMLKKLGVQVIHAPEL